MKKLENSLHCIDSISQWSGKIVSFLILVLMCVVLIEVVMRYVLNNPTKWVHEMSLYLFGGAINLGAAYTLLHKGHVTMDVVQSRLSPRGKAIMDIATFIFFFIFVAVLLWKGWHMAWKAFQFMERTESSWGPVIWPSRLVIPVGAFLLLLQGIAKFVRDILTVTGRTNT